jgi:PAS domain S-box-containing protein
VPARDRRRGDAAERRESARRLAAVVEGMSEAFLSLDAAWRVTYANLAACRLNGVAREALLGCDHWRQWPETAGSAVERAYRAVVATGVPARFEHHYPGADVWHAIQAYPAEDGGLAVFYRDVTAEKRAEAERARLLAEAEAMRAAAEHGQRRLHEIFRQAPAFIAVLRGPDHVFELANADYYRLVGRRDLVGRPLREALPEVVAQGFPALLDGVLATGAPYVGREVPVLLARTPGAPTEERSVTFVYQPLVEADGTRSGVFVHGIDVTDSVQARRAVEATAAALAASEGRYRSLSEAVPVLVWTARPDGALDFVSDRTAVYFGTTAAALLGEGWSAYVHPEDVPTASRRWADARAAATPYEAELRLRGADGEYRWHLARALPVRDAAGAVTGWVGSNTDVEAERRARAEAERANATKAEFLAAMSHELRTPLNAIGGYAELIELGIRGPVTPQQVEDLGRIRASQQHLLGLINSVLNHAKLEAGRVEYDLADVPLGQVVAAVEALVAPQVRARGLAYDFPACDPALAARADPEKLRQIVLNLLSNAVKFTPAGGRITVTCEAAGADAVAVRVADTGVGIAREQLGRVFDPFVQVGRRLASNADGVGLGLAISRDLARGMGGDLTAESTPGVGSTFTLALPAA